MGRLILTQLLSLIVFLSCKLCCALYLRDSNFVERLVPSPELCHDQEIEYYPSPEGQSWPIRNHSIYRRTSAVYERPKAEVYDRSKRTYFQALAEEGTAVANDLRRIYSRDIVVSKSMLERGVSNFGDISHVRRAVRKLVTGKPIKVVALGGSVTLGHGPQSQNNTYINRFFSWIQEAFPNPEHQLLNHGLPAVTSAYICPCVLNLVPEDIDLVLLEFTFNDSERGAQNLEDSITRSMERMLRKLLRLSKQPGIVYIQYWAGRRQQPFAGGVEDTYNKLLKYYGLLGVSMRDALHQLHTTDEAAIATMFQPIWDGDATHPSCVGSRYLADLVIGHFQDLAAAELVSHHLGEPEPAGDSIVAAATGGKHTRESDAARGLPAPLQADNWGLHTEDCIIDPATVRQLVRPLKGFEWVDEGRRSPKWGFVGWTPGDQLEMFVPVKGLSRELTIGIGFLMSYNHMGQAGIDCVSGCSCRRREYSFLHQHLISISGWRVTDVEVEPDSGTCVLRVSILNRTYAHPPEHKVKVTSLMITEEPGFTMPWLFCDDCAT